MNQPEPAAGTPTVSGVAPMGLMAPLTMQSQAKNVFSLQAIATQLLKDDLHVQQLTERVYQLMKQDFQDQRERLGYYGRRR